MKAVRGGYERWVNGILADRDRNATLAKEPYFWSFHRLFAGLIKQVRQEMLVPYPGVAQEVKRRYDETAEGFRGTAQLSSDTDWLVDTVTLFAQDLRSYAEQIDREEARQQNRPATPTPGEPTQLPQLPDGAYKILRYLAASPSRLKQQDLQECERPPMSRKVVSDHLRLLAEHGLIEYNSRNKKGAMILPKGRACLQ